MRASGRPGAGHGCWSLSPPCCVEGAGRHDAGQAGPGEIGQVGGEFACGAWGDRRAATSRRPSGPGRRRRGPTARRPPGRGPACCSATGDRGRRLRRRRGRTGCRSGRCRRPVEGLLVDDEPVELRVGLDERQVGVDRGRRPSAAGGRCCPIALAQLAAAAARRPGRRRRRRARSGRRSAGRRRSCWCRPRPRSPPCRRRRRACRPRRGWRRRAARGGRAGARPTGSRGGPARRAVSFTAPDGT